MQVPKPKKRPKAKPIRYYRNKADKLLQEYIRLLYKKCFFHTFGGCKGTIVGHHFITKASSSNLRYDMDNIIPLCAGKCHFKIHTSGSSTIMDAEIIRTMGWGWYDKLQVKRYNPNLKTNKSYYLAVIEELETKIREIKDAH